MSPHTSHGPGILARPARFPQFEIYTQSIAFRRHRRELHAGVGCASPSGPIGWAIIAEASLSFLGFGLRPDLPSWGTMLSCGGRQYLEMAPRLAMWRGLR